MTYKLFKNMPRHIRQARECQQFKRKARTIKKGNEIMAWPV